MLISKHTTMKILHKLCIILATLFATACNDNFLDINPVDRYSDAAVWNDESLINAYVNNIYLGQMWGFHTVMLSSLCDESMEVWSWESQPILQSAINPSYQGILAPNFWIMSFHNICWNNLYKNIRYCNSFFKNTKNPSIQSNKINQLSGEVHYLRAYFYFWLMRQWGGVPLIEQVYTPNDEMLVARNTFSETVDYIVNDLDEAIKELPLNEDKTRATKGAAMALKARVLLYAASDLFNKTQNWAPEYKYPELIGYTDNNQRERWQKAKDAAKDVINLGVYHLVGENGHSNSQSATDNYINMFLTQNTSEDIMLIYYDYINYGSDWQCPAVGKFNTPNGFHGWGGNTPTGQFIDSFEMADGSRFDWNRSECKNHPYENRDPRFYANILYDGAHWRKRPDDVIGREPLGNVQTGYYQQANGSYNPGIDTRQGVDDWNGTYTGYYMRKFIDPSIDHQYNFQNFPFRESRYTEVLLNYAECCIELGEDEEAKRYINMIRKRANMPNITENKEALKERYRNERKIELCYEQQRYFDIRRWMIAPQVIQNVQGIDIRYPYGKSDPVYIVTENVQQRSWNNKSYLMPIYLDEINKNKLLIQNPGY